MPEALINGAALLGWNPPHREDASVISGPVSIFMKSEVLGMKDLNDLVIHFLKLIFDLVFT